jgi:hypothetical protein
MKEVDLQEVLFTERGEVKRVLRIMRLDEIMRDLAANKGTSDEATPSLLLNQGEGEDVDVLGQRMEDADECIVQLAV